MARQIAPPLPLATYRRRRNQALLALRQHCAGPVPLLVLGIETDCSATGQHLLGRLRQDPWFDWCCGCREADAALLLDPSRPHTRDTLFLDPGDPKRVVWDGARTPPGPMARRAFGMHATAPIKELAERVAEAARRADGRIALLWRQHEPGFQSHAAQRWRRRLRGLHCLNGEAALLPLRMIKDADEIRLHRKAVAITATAYAELMSVLPALRRESHIVALLARHYLGAANETPAFTPIAGGGANAATLHYPQADAPLPRGGAPVLVDSGARVAGYCADVTRTLPRDGRFRGQLRELYQLVLTAQALGIRHARPGISLAEWNAMAWEPILAAGFTRHHGLGHHLGLDVHDPADRHAVLAPGMLITCEPGVYLADAALGIRIEDNLLITAKGCEVTTRAIPRAIEAIEAQMGADH